MKSNKFYDYEISKDEESFLNEFQYDKDKYFIVVYYFQYMLRSGFKRILDFMSQNKDISTDSIGCCFASNCDDEDKENRDYFENGVMFWYGYEEIEKVIIDYQMFYQCLALSCQIYLNSNPDNEIFISPKLNIIKNRYSIEDNLA